MCVAVSGRLVERTGHKGKVDIRGNIVPVELGLVSAELGDDVLVHAGCAISVLRPGEKQELEELFNLLEEAANEER